MTYVGRDKALARIQRGQRVFIGTGCAEPVHLVEGLLSRADELQDVQLLHFLNFSQAASLEKRYDRRFRHNAFFVGPNTREAINQARADYTPVFISEIPGLFASGLIPIDVALIQVSEPDRFGYVSLGISVDVVKAAVDAAGLVIAQVNPRMPRTMGQSFIHVSKIDYLVRHETELLEFRLPAPSGTGLEIAAKAAGLVHDGDTLHIGYGQIPHAVLDHLDRRRHLGLHTEIVSDKYVDLIEAGVFDGDRKTLQPGRIVLSFCIGTRKTYDYVDQNPRFMFMPSEYVYSPRIICQNENMISIGAALEVDLSGQVCSDSQGHHFYSGVGGRLDFMRGAALAKNGRSVVCLPATSLDGQKSRIVPHLAEGSGVVATRGDIHYLVTEFGVVSLRAKSIRERAMALIGVAHPRFRQELLREAKARGYVYPDQIIINTDKDQYPYWVESPAVTRTGLSVMIRPIKPTDEVALQQFFYSHSEKTIYNRHFRLIRAMPHDRAQELVNVDYQDHMAVVATQGPLGHEEILGVARYAHEKGDGRPELAITVRDAFQGQGLGSLLQVHLARYARALGFKGLTAFALATNQALLALFGRLGPFHRAQVEASICRLWIDFEEFSPEAEEATRPPDNLIKERKTDAG